MNTAAMSFDQAALSNRVDLLEAVLRRIAENTFNEGRPYPVSACEYARLFVGGDLSYPHVRRYE